MGQCLAMFPDDRDGDDEDGFSEYDLPGRWSASVLLVGLDRAEERQHALGEQCRGGGVVRRE